MKERDNKHIEVSEIKFLKLVDVATLLDKI
jgi:hypothetical protein